MGKPPSQDRVIYKGYEMRMTDEEINRYEVLEAASKGGRTKAWFLGETDNNTSRNNATQFLLENGYLEEVHPVRSIPLRTTESGETLRKELSNKFWQIYRERH